MEVHGQQIGPMSTRFAHEQHQPVLVRDDEPVPAAESCGGVHDHRDPRLEPSERAAVVNCVIARLTKGNADAVANRL
jgi:hypothetical protein